MQRQNISPRFDALIASEELVASLGCASPLKGHPQGVTVLTAPFSAGPTGHGGAVITGARAFSSLGACVTPDFPKSARFGDGQWCHRGSASMVPTGCEAASVVPAVQSEGTGASGLDAAASVFVLTGRGSFRPIQSSLTKAALSRPIMPKVLPPQATGHLAGKFLWPAW